MTYLGEQLTDEAVLELIREANVPLFGGGTGSGMHVRVEFGVRSVVAKEPLHCGCRYA